MYDNVIINHDPVMTLTYFRTRSTWVAYEFEWRKFLKCDFKGNSRRKLANGQNFDYSKTIGPQGFICPYTGAIYHNIETCLVVHIADLR